MLTLSQRKTFDFIKNFFAENNYSPTAAEIADGIGIKSRGVVHRYLKVLENSGLIKLTPKRHRNICIVSESNSSSVLPLIGVIAAGQPIEAIEQHEAIDLLSVFLGDNRFALRVKGESMVEDGIQDGDIIVCERMDHVNDGQIVVALIDQDEATLKRLQRLDEKTIVLHPANSAMRPMVYEAKRVTIQGVYIGLLRIDE